MKNTSHNILQATLILLSAAVVGLGVACVTPNHPTMKGTSVKTFVEPSIQSSGVKSIAVLPIRNVRLLPDEIREVNRGITDGLRKQNPNLKLVGAVESVTMLNSAGLADKYSEFLRNYTQSAIPDVSILKEIGKALGADAILQGEVFSVEQNDGYLGVNGVKYYGKTSLSIRYVLLSTSNGGVLWEATGTAFKLSEKPQEPAPTLYEVIQMAQEKILSALPVLAQ